MIECKNGVWVNPRHVVTVEDSTDKIARVCVYTAEESYYTDLPLHVVIAMVDEANR